MDKSDTEDLMGLIQAVLEALYAGAPDRAGADRRLMHVLTGPGGVAALRSQITTFARRVYSELVSDTLRPLRLGEGQGDELVGVALGGKELLGLGDRMEVADEFKFLDDLLFALGCYGAILGSFPEQLCAWDGFQCWLDGQGLPVTVERVVIRRRERSAHPWYRLERGSNEQFAGGDVQVLDQVCWHPGTYYLTQRLPGFD